MSKILPPDNHPRVHPLIWIVALGVICLVLIRISLSLADISDSLQTLVGTEIVE